MSLILALENELHRRIRYSIASSAVVVRLAEDFMSSGLVAENVNIIVRFTGSTVTNPSKGANIAEVRTKELDFDVEIRYKNSQRHGHSFALAMLDSISCQVTGFIPDLTASLGANNPNPPYFQTGFELMSERLEEKTEASQYVYIQSYKIITAQGQGAIGEGYPCPTIYDKTELIDCLPCKRCLKTTNGIPIGIAEWKNPIDDSVIYVFDQLLCPLRPLDRLNINLGDKIGANQYEVDIEFIPNEAISFDPVQGEVINDSLVIRSSFSPYFNSEYGELPSFCKDFTVIFDVYADFPGKVDRVDGYFLKRIEGGNLIV